VLQIAWRASGVWFVRLQGRVAAANGRVAVSYAPLLGAGAGALKPTGQLTPVPPSPQ
jgi:hypothetical protein